MSDNRNRIIAFALLVIAGVVMLARLPGSVTSRVAGTVTFVAASGVTVAPNDVLLRVRTLRDEERVAAKAQTGGVLRDVRLRVGDLVSAGATVMRIERP